MTRFQPMNAHWALAIEHFTLALAAAGRPPSTIRLRRYQMTRLAAALAPAGPWDVTTDQLVQWVAGRGPSLNTLRSWRGAVRSFYTWGFKTGRIDHNPSDEVPPVPTPTPDPRPTPHAALKQALATSDRRVVLMIRLGHELGLRRAEVAQAHSDDIVDDLAGWSLRVHGKGGKIRTLPLDDGLGATLRALPAGYFFPGHDGGHLSADWVGRLVSRTLPRGWAMHSLRHRFATTAWAVGGDLAIVQTLLGHASPATTRGYVLLPDDVLRRTVAGVAHAA